MKRRIFLILAVASMAFVGCQKEMIVYPGCFSISETQQVKFAPGNLQYNPALNTYSFAETQYSYVGGNNSRISATYNGWIDLFGWGTGSNPTLSSTDPAQYGQFDDWGQYLTNNPGWRTLSFEEWNYVLTKRPNAEKLRGTATVCDIPGLLLLPDKWTLDTINNSITDGYDVNVIDNLKWDTLQNAGAVFLPAAGNRTGTSVQGARTYGRYWSSTASAFNCAFFIGFGSESSDNGTARCYGRSVRLAKVQTSPN